MDKEASVAVRDSKGKLVWVPESKLKTMKEGRQEKDWTPAMKKAKGMILSTYSFEKE